MKPNPESHPPSRTDRIPVDNIQIQDFSAGFRSDAHFHPTLELLLCISGSFRADIRGMSRQIDAGDYVTVFQNVPHSITVSDDGPCRMYQIHFHCPRDRGGWEELSAGDYFLTELELKKSRFLAGKGTRQMEDCLADLLEEYTRREEGWEYMAEWYMQLLVLLLARDLRKQDAVWDGKCVYISRAVRYIGSHCREKLTVSGISNAVGISSRYLNRLFQEQLGLNVSSYVTDVRISRSIDWMVLHPDYPLSQLALDMGFSSQQHFSRVFREEMGMPPGKYFSRLREQNS